MTDHRHHGRITGTTVTFKPDPEMFDTTEYDYETLHTRMREAGVPERAASRSS